MFLEGRTSDYLDVLAAANVNNFSAASITPTQQDQIPVLGILPKVGGLLAASTLVVAFGAATTAWVIQRRRHKSGQHLL